MAYSFPTSPVNGQLYPVGAGQSGKIQYRWDSASQVWSVVPTTLRTNNQLAFNDYVWPEGPLEDGYQLTTDVDGVLSWNPAALPMVKSISLLETFNDLRVEFTMVETGTTDPVTPEPPENVIVFLGGVPQIKDAAYTVSSSTITFTEAPATGTIFSAVTIVNAPG